MTIQCYQTAREQPHDTWRDIGEARVSSVAESNAPQADVDQLIILRPEKRRQTIRGFGGAFTEAAAWVWTQLPEDEKQQVLNAYFDRKSGIGYTYGRTHMNSCDFSLGNYAAASVPGDVELRNFSVERENQYLWPFIHAASKVAGTSIPLLVSPWSPPAWMKTNQDMNNGGSLLPEYRDAWARYYAKYIDAMRGAGLQVFGITIQNEPEATQVWESCRFTASEEAQFLGAHLGPVLSEHGIDDVRVFVWDHNRDLAYARAQEIFDDPMAARYAHGIAIHWYSGDDFDQVLRTNQAYPEKEIVFTEGCIEGGVRLGRWDRGEIYAHNIIGDLNAGVSLWLDWNLLLDQRGGPNHVGNYCDAPVVADLDAKRLHFQSSYAYIGHFSRFIQPEAVRISADTANGEPAPLEATAVENPDGSLVCVVLNATDVSRRIALSLEERVSSEIRIPEHSITTCVWSRRTDS